MISLVVLAGFSLALTAAATQEIVPSQAKGARTVSLQAVVEGDGVVHLVTGTGANCATGQARVVSLPKTTQGGPAVAATTSYRIGGRQPVPVQAYTITDVALPAGKALCVSSTAAQPVRVNAEAKP